MKDEKVGLSEVRFPDVKVKLVGEDGNAFAILGRVAQALRKAGHGEYVSEFRKEATAGDYDHLLAVACKWVNVR